MATQTAPQPVRTRTPTRVPAARARSWEAAAVAGPAALAIALCLYELTTRSLWLDEAATAAIASQHGAALWSAIARDGGNMLGYYALLHVLVSWFGDGTLVLRVPSALAAGAATGAVGLLGLRLFDRRVAIAAGLLTAVSLPLVFWGQDARGYALMVALVAGSFVAFVALVEDRKGAWIAYVALTSLAVYASFIAILVIPTQILALLWRRHVWRRVAAAIAVCGLSWIPLAVLAIHRGSGQLFWIPRPSLTTEKQVIQALTSAAFEPNFHLAAGSTALLIATVLLLALAAVAIVRHIQWGPVLALSWLVVPVGVMWLESFAGQPLFTARNALVSLPGVALLLGWVIVRIRLAWLALAVLIALRALQLAPAYGTSPEDWRAAASYVIAASRPGDCIAFYPLDGRMAFDYYVTAGAPRPVLPSLPWSQIRPYVERYDLPRVPLACPRVWLVASHEGFPTGPPGSRAHYERYVALRAALAGEYAHDTKRPIGYASTIWVELFSR
jgi:mannosyltransferase